ncbi:hypothetical protein I548_4087 [Mycobacterium intracellulare]|nr:hypothetical protein I548_4087 [Mycobacterium intracellulare]
MGAAAAAFWASIEEPSASSMLAAAISASGRVVTKDMVFSFSKRAGPCGPAPVAPHQAQDVTSRSPGPRYPETAEFTRLTW